MTTKTKKPSKKAPPEKFVRCYIEPSMANKLSPGAGGEGFWCAEHGPNTLEVCNNLLCGLSVGDIIEFKEYPDDGVHHPRHFVKVVERKSELYSFHYTFKGIGEVTDKLPKNIQEHLRKIEEKGCRFEGVIKGIAAVSRPINMNEVEFFTLLNSGPMTFTKY